MSENKASYAKIGFFVLLGGILILLAVAVAGTRVFKRQTVLAETYFSESVSGLDIGSTVKYRGVPVGEVQKIGFVYPIYVRDSKLEVPAEQSRQIMVVMSLDPSRFTMLDIGHSEALLERMAGNGLRAKISASGVTGMSFIQLDYFGGKADDPVNPPLRPVWTPKHIYIPSSRSTIESLKLAMDDMVIKAGRLDIAALGDGLLNTLELVQKKLNNADVETANAETLALLKELRSTSEALKNIIESPDLSKIPAELLAAVSGFRSSADQIAKDLPPLTGKVGTLAERAAAVAEQTGETVAKNGARLESTLAQLEAAIQTFNRTAQAQQGNLAAILREVREAAVNLNKTLKELSDNPSAVLFGEPPRRLPEDSEENR